MFSKVWGLKGLYRLQGRVSGLYRNVSMFSKVWGLKGFYRLQGRECTFLSSST